MERDKRSFEIKKTLNKQYPENRFKVRIEKYSGGESINIHTDILKDNWHSDAVWRVEAGANPTSDDIDKYNKYRAIQEYNKTKTTEIKKLIGSYESLDIDEITGEILLGGNTYLFIKPFINPPLKE